jgi:hypothetical protein
MMKENKKDKFEQVHEALAKEVSGIIPPSYTYRGKSLEISDKAKNVAAEMFATEFAGYERIDQAKQDMDGLKKEAQDKKGLKNEPKREEVLIRYFQKVNKAFGNKTDYSEAPTTEVLGHIKRAMGQHAHLVDSYLEDKDPTLLDVLPNVIAEQTKQQVSIQSKQKMDALKDKDGQIDPEHKLQVSYALSAMTMKSSLGTVCPNPYVNAMDPDTTLDSMVRGMRSQTGGGTYNNASWADRAVNQYAN